jgi:hypothetical protein
MLMQLKIIGQPSKTVPQLRRLVTGFQQRPPRSCHVGFFSEYLVSLTTHSTDCSKLIIIHLPELVQYITHPTQEMGSYSNTEKVKKLWSLLETVPSFKISRFLWKHMLWMTGFQKHWNTLHIYLFMQTGIICNSDIFSSVLTVFYPDVARAFKSKFNVVNFYWWLSSILWAVYVFWHVLHPVAFLSSKGSME